MSDCAATCAGYGADCRNCVQTSDPTEKPSLYRPLSVHAVAARLVAQGAADERQREGERRRQERARRWGPM